MHRADTAFLRLAKAVYSGDLEAAEDALREMMWTGQHTREIMLARSIARPLPPVPDAKPLVLPDPEDRFWLSEFPGERAPLGVYRCGHERPTRRRY